MAKREGAEGRRAPGEPPKAGEQRHPGGSDRKGGQGGGGKGGDDLPPGVEHCPLQIVPRLPEGEEQGLRNTRHRKR